MNTNSTVPNIAVLIAVNAKFSLGRLVATPGSLDLLRQTGFVSDQLLSRFVTGDWGDACREDAAMNDQALVHGDRLMGVYRLVDPEKLAATKPDRRSDLPTVWIITEWDRSVTTILLPQEY